MLAANLLILFNSLAEINATETYVHAVVKVLASYNNNINYLSTLCH